MTWHAAAETLVIAHDKRDAGWTVISVHPGAHLSRNNVLLCVQSRYVIRTL